MPYTPNTTTVNTTTTTTTTTPTTTTPARTTPLPTTSAVSPGSASVQGTQAINTVLTYLQAQIGKPYKFNAAGPDSFDCSGLVLAGYAQIGVSLPHQSLLQSKYGAAVDWLTQPIMPGDLVFTISSSNPGVISHVGIALDSRTWIQAARTGTPVRIGNLPSAERIQAVRRLVQP